ncbi:hypothetical protein BX666DRAFT_711827 [Dichotomocladium elegans]|nr:hypothetical protein BX666DRAFT_711827 [Dichotomocladium elegans]
MVCNSASTILMIRQRSQHGRSLRGLLLHFAFAIAMANDNTHALPLCLLVYNSHKFRVCDVMRECMKSFALTVVLRQLHSKSDLAWGLRLCQQCAKIF